jgi:hypothetical protein
MQMARNAPCHSVTSASSGFRRIYRGGMVEAILLFVHEAYDFRDQFREFLGILFDRSLFAQFHPFLVIFHALPISGKNGRSLAWAGKSLCSLPNTLNIWRLARHCHTLEHVARKR